ncbi:alpha/beta hydrolase [Mycobacterium sp. OAE908]|uniref:alpha/beta hydrolase n=1 Tax=Mycobacterium sp. OAE908 TaxID=2817899 RepID=UPI001AE99FB5
MTDRFSAWLGAVMVAAGVAAAMIAGAGVAIADEGDGSAANGATSSESAKPTENKEDSGAASEKPGRDEAEPNAKPADEEPATVKESKGSDTAEKAETKPAKRTTVGHKPAAKQTAKKAADEPESEKATEPAESAVESVADVAPVSTPAIEEPAPAPKTAAVAFAAPRRAAVTSTATTPPFSGLLSAIGTLVFNLYGLATRLVGGPPTLPPNSTVTVHSSTLRLDCAKGYDVPADWYIPNSAEPPTRLIYLQHGFLASGPWYSHTAAALAEQTNSIVVAPTITSNFLSCDACWLGAPRMQQTVANLFADGNTALADSTLAAGYTGAIPDRVVLVGHSLGGGLVAGTAGYMADNGSVDRLAGVVMLDGVPLDGTAAASLKKVPADIPIYQLASPKYFWNQFGVGTEALLAARPDQFIGVTLVGGSHVDSMRGGNPLIQFSQQLASGFSKPQNVAAAQVLMVGWVNDMFAGNHDKGIYVDAGESVTIQTSAGPATAVALPNSLTKPFILNPLQAFVALGNGFFTFEPTCGPVEPACKAEPTQEPVAA